MSGMGVGMYMPKCYRCLAHLIVAEGWWPSLDEDGRERRHDSREPVLLDRNAHDILRARGLLLGQRGR